MPLAEAALEYVSYGWFLLPVVPRGKAPHGEFLSEIYGDSRTTHLRRARALRVEVEYWFANESSLNLGVIPCAESGLVIVDVDDLDSINPVFETPTASSGREGGGRHFYFASGEALPTRAFSWGHLNPAHAVLPGSLHETGRRYEWLDGSAPDEVALMPFEDAQSVFGISL